MFPFPIFVPVAATGAAVSISYLTSATDTTDLTTYNGAVFQGLSFGAAAAGRYIVVAIGSRANAARSISSVTIGGVSAAVVSDGVTTCVANDTSGGADLTALWIANVPTGTTGDVVVTFSGAMLRCAISLFRMTGNASATASQVKVDTTLTGQVYSVAIDSPANGGIIGGYWCSLSAGTGSVTWAGITEAVDGTVETTSSNYSAASGTFFAAQSALTVSGTQGGTASLGGLAVASWGP